MWLAAAFQTVSAQQYNYLHYSVNNGLPQARIYSEFQDSRGYLWIGTEGGVSRFDGHEFETFSVDNGFPASTVTAINEDNEGVLLGTDQGLVVFSYGKFTLYRKNGFDQIHRILITPGGSALLCTNSGLVGFSENKFTQVKTSTAVDQLDIAEGLFDSRGHLWIGTDMNGVFEFSCENDRYSNLVFPDQEKLVNARIRGLVEIEGGSIWIATSTDGLFSFDGNALTMLNIPLSGKLFFTCAHKDIFGDVWLGTWGSGLIHYTGNVFKFYNRSNGLGDDKIQCITSDQQGNTWIGTFSNGVYFFYGDQFTSLTKADGLPDNEVHGIVQDDEGNMWFGTSAGLAMFDGVDVKNIGTGNADLEEGIGALATDGKQIFAGSTDGAIVVVDGNSVRSYTPANEKMSEVISLLYTREGTLWIGTVSEGLFEFTGGKITRVNTGNVLLNNPIWSIYESVDGVIWLGTEKGAFRMHNGSALRPESDNPSYMPDTRIYSICGDNDYIYFTSQGKGLFRWSRAKKHYEVFSKREGIGSLYTTGILWMNSNTMFVTHSLGMDKIIFSSDSQQVRHFWYSDGIGTDNFTPSCMYFSREGKLWLGSSNGVIIYSIGGDKGKLSAPLIEIKDVLLFNQRPDWKSYSQKMLKSGLPFEPVLPYGQNQINFHLAGIQYGAGVNIQYSYMLEGLDSSWTMLHDGNSISYTNLPPGDYRFLVKAGNSNNAWSVPTEFRFSIKPPFWGTWWFFIIVLSIISGISLVLVFLYRRFKSDFVRRHRSFGDYQLTTSRMILLFSGILYPVSFFVVNLFPPYNHANGWDVIAVGALLTFAGAATYYSPFFRKSASLITQILYPLLIFHICYLAHQDQLNPVTIAMLLVALGAGGIVFDNMRSAAVFSTALLAVIGILIFTAGNNTGFNKWVLLLGTIVVIIITIVSVLSRLNLFNRLVFADTTINNSRSLVIAADESGKIIFVSRSVKAILGYDEEEVMGDKWWKVRTTNQDENDRMREKILASSGTQASYIAPLRAKNGSTRWIQWSDTEIGGGIKVGIGLDVSDRIEIEERYRHIVESATDIIYTADYRGNLNFINDVAKKITGFSQEDLIGKHFTQFVRADWVDDVKRFYEKQFSRKTVSSYYEFPIISAAGKEIWLGQTVRLLFDETRPNLIRGFQAIARDITEKKRYEEELEKLSLVASETINGVLICEPDGRIEWVNDGFTRITGFSLEEVKGKMPGDVLAGDRTDWIAISEVREFSKKAEGFQKEFLVYHKNGSEIWLSVSNTPIVDEHGTILNQIEIFNDITEKKRYEIQLNRYSSRLETLNMTKMELLRSVTIEEIAKNVLGSLASRLPFVIRTSMALFDERDGFAEMYFVLKNDNKKLSRYSMPLNNFRSLPNLYRNTHLLINDLQQEENLSESDRENISAGVRSYLVMPLYTQGKLIGSVNIGAPKAYSIGEEDIEMIREMADAMAATVQQLRYLEIIEQKNEDISASILYARRIQDAILPPEEMLRDQVGDLFVLHRPKDMLSGDFYWAEKKGKFTFLAVVDSTGHGVPGALLSLMGNNLLNQAVHERHLVRPSAVLDYLNAGIQHTLNQYKKAGELRDGMDITLCVFEEGTNRMQYAGAINPLYVIRDEMVIQSKGNRFSIGSYFDNRMRPFTNQEMELQKDDVVYLFSDGFPDQFGGTEDRKLSHRRFREILLEVHKEEMSVQKRMLEEQLNMWMNGEPQTDDICVIGIRIR
ncbi:MAG TPA: PAS domain S-box protein [Bacteroidia bacterium]|nr:PAS domain S-box protein [Bacteroidia bacterium]